MTIPTAEELTSLFADTCTAYWRDGGPARTGDTRLVDGHDERLAMAAVRDAVLDGLIAEGQEIQAEVTHPDHKQFWVTVHEWLTLVKRGAR